MRADNITLQDGRELEGRFTRLNAMLADPNVAGAEIKPIVMCDNDLSYTYVAQKFVTAVQAAPANQRLEEIDVQQAVATVGARIGGVGAILKVEPWDAHGPEGFGRRIFSMAGGPTGRIDVIQGITKITPVWTRVQGLQVKQSYIWDMRLATSSVPAEVLSKIIKRQINPKNADDRLKVVRFYLQAERYQDATAELNQIIDDFPGRAGLAAVARRSEANGCAANHQGN